MSDLESTLSRLRVRIDLSLYFVPLTPAVLGILFVPSGDSRMTGIVRLSPADPIVVKRATTVTVNGTALPVLDMIDPNLSFQANPNDSVTATCTDSDAAGNSSQPSPVYSATAPTGPPPPPPPPGGIATPTVLGIDWSP